MRDLSLHILDIIENSIRAGASEVRQVVLDPFYTTKKGKHVGLGLSLFREAALRAGGDLKLRRSGLGGLAVEATMGLTHVDRPPLGDVAGMVSAVVCTNPDLGLCCTFSVAPRHLTVRAVDVLQSLSAKERGGLAVARAMAERTRQAIGAVQLLP
jgi:hypothetical protein